MTRRAQTTLGVVLMVLAAGLLLASLIATLAPVNEGDYPCSDPPPATTAPVLDCAPALEGRAELARGLGFLALAPAIAGIVLLTVRRTTETATEDRALDLDRDSPRL